MPKEFSRRRIAAYAIVAILAFTVLGNLGGTLAKMHLPGREAGDITAIASPSSNEDDARKLTESWADWDRDREGDRDKNNSAPPGAIAGAWLIIDSLLLAPAIAMALQRLTRRRATLLVGSARIGVLLRVSIWLVIAYLAADELENVFTAAFVFYDRWILLNWISLLKWLFLALTVLIVLASFVRRLREAQLRQKPPAVMPTVRALRMPLVCVALAAVAMMLLPAGVRPQLQDVVRTWVPGDRWPIGLLAVGALALLMLSIWAATALVHRRLTPPREFTPFSRLRYGLYVAVAFFIGGLAALSFYTADVGVRAASVVSIGLLAYVALSWLWAPRTSEDEPGEAKPTTSVSLLWPPVNFQWNPTVARALIAIPGLAFAVMVLSAIDLARPGWPRFIGVAFALGGLTLSAGAWAVVQRRPGVLRRAGLVAAYLLLLLGAVTALELSVFTYITPVTTGNDFGSVALLLSAITGFLAIAVGAEQLFWGPPHGLFARLRLARAPLLALLVGVFALSSFFDASVEFHEARTLASKAGSSDAMPAKAATTDAKKLLNQYASSMPARSAGVLPVFVVAAEGGGGRAAYWMLDVLNCLFGGAPPHELDAARYVSPACARPKPRWRAVLAASGISGGSVGLAMYKSESKPGHRVLGAESMFDDGFLDPTMANLLYMDTPNALLRADTWPDRAEALERAFEDVAPGLTRGLFATQLQQQTPESEDGPLPTFPILMLNSAGVEDGCRINVAVVRLAETAPDAYQGDPERGGEPVDRSCTSLTGVETPPFAHGGQVPTSLAGALSSTRDVADYVCAHNGTDIQLSTAALLSARFPYVSPTGALQSCGKDKDLFTFAVDGGYVDSSGASPLVGLLERLIAYGATDPDLPCIQPIVLQVDNGYAGLSKPSATGRPRELTAPLSGRTVAAESYSGASGQALAELATGHRCPVRDDLPQDHPLRSLPSYLHVYPRAHPGAEAPLGWSLSSDSRRDLDKQLVSNENQCALANAKAWLIGSVSDLPSCTAFTPNTDCVRVTGKGGSDASAIEPLPCPVKRRDTKPVPEVPRANAAYNLCSGDLNGCPSAPLAKRCPIQVDVQGRCRIKTDAAGAIRFITSLPLGQQSTFSLIATKVPTAPPGISDAAGRHFLTAALAAIALLMFCLVLSDSLRELRLRERRRGNVKLWA